MHGSPAGHLSDFCVRVTVTKTVPAFCGAADFRALRRFFFRGLLCARCRCFFAFFFFFAFGTGSRRCATATELFTPPPYGSCAFHTSLPVSAFTANTPPPVLAV